MVPVSHAGACDHACAFELRFQVPESIRGHGRLDARQVQFARPKRLTGKDGRLYHGVSEEV